MKTGRGCIFQYYLKMKGGVPGLHWLSGQLNLSSALDFRVMSSSPVMGSMLGVELPYKNKTKG